MRIDARTAHISDLVRYRAYLDGQELRYCLMADEEAGVALVAVTDDRGRLTDETAELHGHVELRLPSTP